MAAYFVAESYRKGMNGAAINMEEAFNYHKQGIVMTENSLCLYGMGICYLNGDGTAKDEKKALEYLKRAFPGVERLAENGNKDAQFHMGEH